ncbi:MAG: GNAT family N-acetyltransferase [Verrucomicrobiota bacterium]
MQIRWIPEHQIDSALHGEIAALRNACFPDGQHPRSYFKQLPHFRILAFDGDTLIGHAGVDHRVMNFGGNAYRAFGAIDVCVEVAHRGQGIAGIMMSRLEEEAVDSGADVMVLVADDHRLYLRLGFQLLDAECEWMAIDEHRNHGILKESLAGELMIKPLKSGLELDGPVDWLGYLY